MIDATKFLNLLGFRVIDKVTGFKGVVTCICFDLPGCIQASINPGIGADGKLIDPVWFDVSRLTVVGATPVMSQPEFINDSIAIAQGKKGPVSKSPLTRNK